MSPRHANARPSHHDAASPSDAEVLHRLAAGEIGALGVLYDRYQAPLRGFLGRATADAEDVDDLVHATFLAAAKIAARYDGRASCGPWLLGIAAQLLRRRKRAFGRLFAVLASLGGVRATSVDPRPAQQARDEVERALMRLSEAKRVAILLAEVEGLSCDEIARALRIPVGTVWTRLHAARRELRAALGDEAGS